MKITLKHQILKQLREEKSIPVEAIHKKLRISIEDYQKLESQDATVDTDFADKVAHVFRRNWTVFLLDNLPKQVPIDHDNRTTKNKAPSFHEKTINAIEDANFILEFSNSLGIHFPLQLPKLDDTRVISAEALAAAVRMKSGISIEEQKKFRDSSEALKIWSNYVESKGIYVSQYPLDVDDKIHAFSIFRNDRAIIVLNTNDTISSRIFSLIHEYCHITRRKSGLGICDLHHSKSTDVEVYCNRFAAEFLVPLQEINDYLKSQGRNAIETNLEWYVNKLAGQFRVSKLVIYRRLNTLGLINDIEYSKIHDECLVQFQAHRRTKHEDEGDEDRGGPSHYIIRKLRNGVSYSNNVLDAFEAGAISAFETSNALGVAVENIETYRAKTAHIDDIWAS